MPSVTHTEPYHALAAVYQAAGLAEYSVTLASHLLERAFELDWTGRTLIDLACGTGDLTCWFADRGVRTTGVDLSPAMLRFGVERARQHNYDAQFVAGDIRAFTATIQAEMVTCVGNALNYIATLHDLENVFRRAFAATQPGKLFCFDLRTVKGLADEVTRDPIVYDNGEDILILERSAFSYETLLLTTQYTIMHYTDSGWQRGEETHTLRGYPVQAVLSLLAKTGFQIVRTLTPDMQSAENNKDAELLIFVAIRES